MKIKQTPGPAYYPLKAAIKGLKGAQARVGWFESAQYPDGTPVAGVASVQEYGSAKKSIPPRLGLRATKEDKKSEWAGVANTLAKKVVNGVIPPPGLMDGIGAKAAGDFRRHITQVQSPALAAATVRARASRYASAKKGKAKSLPLSLAKPLVDTGILLNTLTFETTK